MKFVDFKKSLSIKVEPCYILFGNDNYLIESSYSNLVKVCVTNYPELNIKTFTNENEIDEILLSCETLPLCNDKMVIIAKNYTITENVKAKISAYMEKPNPTTVLMITTKEKVEIKNCTEVDCNSLPDDILIKKINLELSRKGYTITTEAVKNLIANCENSLTRIFNELEKLISLCDETKTITNDCVQGNVQKDINYSIFKLTEAMGKKNCTEAINVLNYLITQNEQKNLITIMYNYFRRLFYSVVSNGSTNDEVANSLQVKPYAIQIAKEQAKVFGASNLLKIIKELEEIDERIKNTFSNLDNELYAFVLKTVAM